MYWTIALQNDFHHTSVILRVPDSMKLSAGQRKRAKRELCGIDGCTCSDAWGKRGQQPIEPFEIEDLYDRNGVLTGRLIQH